MKTSFAAIGAVALAVTQVVTANPFTHECNVIGGSDWSAWVDFKASCRWKHWNWGSSHNLFHVRWDNTLVYECSCEKGLDAAYGPWSSDTWFWHQIDDDAGCYIRHGQDVDEVIAATHAGECRGTNKKNCDTRKPYNDQCTYY